MTLLEGLYATNSVMIKVYRNDKWQNFSNLLVLRIQDVVEPLVEVAIRGKANIVSYWSTTQYCRHGLNIANDVIYQ